MCQGVYNKTKISLSSVIIDSKHIMARGNPAELLWINHKAKKIWRKKYGGKDGKYKKAHKEAVASYCKKHHKKKR